MKLTSIILSILGCVFLTLGVYVFWIDDVINYTYQIIFGILVVLFVVIYILQAEIDWYWWLRNPPEMPAGLERQMAVMFPFYRNLDTIEKKRFRDRVMLWLNGKEHLVMGLDVFPEEVKSMIAAYGVMMTFGIEKYLLFPYERIIMYPHPFPSPMHEFLHNSEFFDDNGKHGGFIFNAQPLMAGIKNPQKHYHIAIHEFAGAFMKLYPDHDYPTFTEEKIELLQQVKGFNIAMIEKVVGVKDLNPSQIAIEHFFTRSIVFREVFPFDFEQFCKIFNLNPIGGLRPVIEIRKIGANPLAGM